MAGVVEVSPAELVDRRSTMLRELGLSESELRARAEDHSATPDEWDSWTEIQTIRFLLGEDA